MPLKKDPSGRRSVQVEVEVPGTPEEVWQAIATGPGVSAWFVPAEVEERDGKPVTIKTNFGPGMESIAHVTEWDPPRMFAADSADLGPGAPTVATEWIIETRAGGRCLVRVVHSLFASNDDWDQQLEGWEQGWPDFFRILRLYLTHFRGQSSSAFQLMAMAPEPRSVAWNTLSGALGLSDARESQRFRASSGAPTLAGQVEFVGAEPYPEQLLLRLDQPTPGVAHLFAMSMEGQVVVSIRLYLYGDRAAKAVAHEQPRWQAWLREHFPPAPN